MGKHTTNLPMKPRISNIIVDDNLDMGIYDIRANEVRAARVYSPIDTDEWATETLEWGDVPPSTTTIATGFGISSGGSVLPVYTVGSATERITLRLSNITASLKDAQIRANDVAIASEPNDIHPGTTYTFPYCIVKPGDVIAFYAFSPLPNPKVDVELLKDGVVFGPKTFNLTGKWLALGIDMQGLAATVKIQGVEMPYTDYAKYFPIAPTELKIPGEWTPEQVRPVIEVYK